MSIVAIALLASGAVVLPPDQTDLVVACYLAGVERGKAEEHRALSYSDTDGHFRFVGFSFHPRTNQREAYTSMDQFDPTLLISAPFRISYRIGNEIINSRSDWDEENSRSFVMLFADKNKIGYYKIVLNINPRKRKQPVQTYFGECATVTDKGNLTAWDRVKSDYPAERITPP